MCFELGNYEQKQRINLSCTALSVLDGDYELFGADSRSGFYNRILTSFFDNAKASVDVAVARYAADLTAALPAITDNAVKEALTAHYRRQLRAEIEAYPKGDSVLFRLNNENYQHLYNEYGEQLVETANYTSVGKYLKALLEEYARLSPSQRERVYYSAVIDDVIQPAIDAGYALQVSTGGMTFLVTPYAVLADTYSAHLYLTGLSRAMNDGSAEATIASFRISRLTNVRLRKSASHRRLTIDEKHEIEKKLRAVGVQYLLGNREVIRLRLTERGLQSYMQRSYMRPYADAIGKDGICTFSCSARQIENYFLSFGADVEILEPLALRTRFINAYREASAVYEEISQN